MLYLSSMALKNSLYDPPRLGKRNFSMQALLLAFVVCSGAVLRTVEALPHKNNTCAPETDFVTMNLWLSNEDSNFEASKEHKFTIHNGHKMTVTGFDSTRKAGLGFRCRQRCSLGVGQEDLAKAVVSELEPGGTYRFRLWQFSRQEEQGGGYWKNEVHVNGFEYDTTMGEDMSAYGYAEATDAGEIEFLFVDTDSNPLFMGFTQVNVARVCGCGSNGDCPGGELCQGPTKKLARGKGVCTPGVLAARCADQDYRSAEHTCKFMAGNGYYAGEAWCTAFPTNEKPNFIPSKMCCGCSAGLSWVKEPYQHDNGGYAWRDFGGFKSNETSGEIVLEVGNGDEMRGIMVDGGTAKTPKKISASAGPTSTGPWTKLAKWKQDKYERSWLDFKTSEPFLQLSWSETYNKKQSRLHKISVRLRDRAADIDEPAGGWSGQFSLVKGPINPNPNCVIADGCVTSPNWPEPYPANEGCEIAVDADTVLVATHFLVPNSVPGTSWDDYFVIDSSARGSSGLFTNSAGPYHVSVLAGDRLVWSVDDWESGSGFRVCGYTPDNGDGALTWPPEKKECLEGYDEKVKCRMNGCAWNAKKSKCTAKRTCSSFRTKDKCNVKKRNCEWNKEEKACQTKLQWY